MSSNFVEDLVRRHPLQRLSSPSRGASALLHVLGLATFAYDFNYLVQNPNRMSESYGWHYQFLTIIALTIATITFGLGLLADISLSPKLFYVKNGFAVASTPLEVLVSLLYWSLKTIDPRLVVADFLPPPPLLADLAFHLVPAVVMVVDLLFFSPPWTITFVPATLTSAVLAFSYWFWIEQCYQNNGFYPYPIFEQLPTVGRVGLFTMSAVVMAANTVALKWVYSKVNGTDAPTETPGALKKKA